MKMRICIKRKFRNRNKSIQKIIYRNGGKIKRFRKKNISIENKNENERKDNYEIENLSGTVYTMEKYIENVKIYIPI